MATNYDVTYPKSKVKDKELHMNLTAKLIKEVEIRPMFWNKYNDLYNNRNVMDLEWGRLSVILKQDKDFLRQKWKNLRDQFQKEVKKMKNPNQEVSIENYRGKWVYFESMIFLKDVVKSGKDAIAHAYPEIEIKDDEDIKEEIIVYEDEDPVATPVQISYVCSNNNGDQGNSPLQFQIVSQDIYSRNEPETEQLSEEDNGTEEPRNQKRKASPVAENPLRQIKVRRLSEDPDNIDDDLHFAKSLVPFLRRLNPIKKLMVRNEIQTILLRESLCDKCNEHSCTDQD